MVRALSAAGATLALAALLVATWLFTGPAVPPPPARPASQIVPRIGIYHYWDESFGSMRDAITSQVQACNRSRPASRLVVTPVSHEAFKVNAPAMLTASNGSELFSWWAGWRTRDLDERGLLAPLDAWWTTAQADKRFSPGLVAQACTYGGGRRCLLPLVQSYIGFFYNVAVFKDAGIAPPATWDGFLAACRTLRGRGINPIALGTSARWPAQFWFDYLLLRTAGPAFRQRLLDGEIAWTDPAVVRTFGLWRELIELGAFNPNPNGSDWLEAAKLLHTRGAAMILMGTWAMDPYAALGWQGGRDYAWFPFPAIDAGVPATTLTVVDGLILAKGSCDEAALAATLDHFSSIDAQLALAKASGSFAPHIGVGPEHYDELRRSIRASIGDSLVPPYDLATPPEAERIGLEAMVRFIDQPQQAASILAATSERLAACFAARRQAVRR